MWTALVALAALAAPASPDLSGTWTLAPATPAPAAARGDLGSGWGSPLTITQHADQLTVEYSFFGPGDLQPPLRFSYTFDGSETSAVVWMGRGPLDLRSRARWEGDRLVIVTAYPLVDPASHAVLSVDVTRTLSLVSPTALTVETVRAGVLGGQPTSARASYTRPGAAR